MRASVLMKQALQQSAQFRCTMELPLPAKSKPLILVSADTRDFQGYTWHAAISTYIRAVASTAQATPLIVPAIGGDMLDSAAMRDMLSHAGGLLITGSRTNVHPENYAVAPSEHHEPYDPARDSTTLPLITMALDMDLPLLAICRGLQELNVALGGTLDTEIQTLDGRADHRAPVDDDEHVRFALAHSVFVRAGGVLEQTLGLPSFEVNSLHRQAIAKLADGLHVEAEAEDGTIEAVSVPGKAFALGLQWHPEYWASHKPEEDAASTAIFKAFGDAARDHKSD